jgi:AraC-like DNA-binding protein
MRWHLPAAWALLDEVTALAGDRVSDPLALARVGVVRASLHFVEGMRARRMADAYCLDMEPGEPDLVASDRHLMACEQHLALVESAGMPGGKAMLAVICALRGDADGMLARLDSPREPRPTGSLGEAARLYNLGAAWRMMGRIDLAQAAHRQAQTVLEGQPSSRNLQLLYFDLHLCAKAAGDHAQALVHLERSVFTGARLSALDLEAAQALVDAVGPLSSAVATWPGLPSQPANLPGSDARLRASEPPCLQRAENLCLAQLPRRLPLASLAEQAGVALRTLQAVARSYRHVTLTEMLRRRVMAEALTRVLHSDRALKDLAEELGYRDPAAFSRDFKRVHGAAPSGYRRPRPQGPGGA